MSGAVSVLGFLGLTPRATGRRVSSIMRMSLWFVRHFFAHTWRWSLVFVATAYTPWGFLSGWEVTRTPTSTWIFLRSGCDDAAVAMSA